MTSSGPRPDDAILKALAHLFAASGFHAVSTADLEQATGETYAGLVTRLGDKEALLYAALEHCRQLDGPEATELRLKLSAMLPAVRKASLNSKLRAVHHKARQRLEALNES